MHLYLGISMGSMGRTAGASSGGFLVMSMRSPFDSPFIGLYGAGDGTLLPVLQRFQRLTRWALIGYTATDRFSSGTFIAEQPHQTWSITLLKL